MVEFSAAYRTVACFASSADAEAGRAQLAAEGIAAAVRDESASGAPRAEAVRLLVPVSELERARALLAPRFAPVPAGPDGALRPAASGAWQAALTTLGLLLFAAAVALLLSFF